MAGHRRRRTSANINWQKVKQSEVDAAILRIGYGHGNEDKYFKNNLAQVRVNRIPHGLYLYSYAYDTDFAREEANFVLQTLRRYSITDKSVPIFYDMEHLDDWGGHTMPTRPIQFEQIAKVFFGVLEDAGYTNLGSTLTRTTWRRASTATGCTDTPTGSPRILTRLSMISQVPGSARMAIHVDRAVCPA